MDLTRKLIVTAALALALTGCSKNDEQAFSKVDYNKDGKIIFEELIVAFPDLTVEEFLAADADHSGGLTEEEFKRFADARKAGKNLALPAKPQAAPATPETGPTTTATPVAPPQAPAADAQNVPATTQVPAGQAQTAELPANAPAGNAPTANAVPMPQADQTPSSDRLGQAEDVETVVAKTPAAPAEAKAPAQASVKTTYVVQRGDTLTRIAKKFGVTTKALMEANELKSADRVDAGATLNIPAKADKTEKPGKADKAAPQAVTTFVADFFTTGDAGDINALLDKYADRVAYYKKGKVGRDIVRQDKANFFQRWPKRAYTPGAVTLVETTKDGELRVSVPVTFTAESGSKTASGEAVFTFRLRPEGGSYKIVGESSAVGKRK